MAEATQPIIGASPERDGLEALAQLGTPAEGGGQFLILRAELRSELKARPESSASKTDKTKSLPLRKKEPRDILGRIAIENARVDDAITHFQRAIAVIKDRLMRACWLGVSRQLVADRVGPRPLHR